MADLAQYLHLENICEEAFGLSQSVLGGESALSSLLKRQPPSNVIARSGSQERSDGERDEAISRFELLTAFSKREIASSRFSSLRAEKPLLAMTLIVAFQLSVIMLAPGLIRYFNM